MYLSNVEQKVKMYVEVTNIGTVRKTVRKSP